MPLRRSKALPTGGLGVLLVLVVAAAGLLAGCGPRMKDSGAAPVVSATEGSSVQEKAAVSQSVTPVDGATVQASVETHIQRAKAADQASAPGGPARGRGSEQDSKVGDSVEITIRGPDGKVKQHTVAR